MAHRDEPTAEPTAASESVTAEASPRSSGPNQSVNKDRQDSASPARSESPASSVTSPTSTERDEAERQEDVEEAGPSNTNPEGSTSSAPPLPNEPLPPQATSSTPPLPSEPVPGQSTPSLPPLPAEPAAASAPQPQDDGWEYHWNASTSSYWFYNRFTQVWQENNPRLQPGYVAPGTATTTTPAAGPTPIAVGPGQVISDPTSVAGGYNPAIHGDYDPNAWYARAATAAGAAAGGGEEEDGLVPPAAVPGGEAQDVEGTAGFFNRHTGAWQQPDQGPERHGDEAKSRRQLNNFFDVDAAANEFEGRSLKAERSGKKPSKAELKAYKEKRRARKEEKRRAWLRD